jgi:hypothetical protein
MIDESTLGREKKLLNQDFSYHLSMRAAVSKRRTLSMAFVGVWGH